MRVGPVAITNGVFGNRPHCIYRGFCLQGCKVNAKASPLVTHLPDAIEHGVEIRADSHGGRDRARRGRQALTGRHLRPRRPRALPAGRGRRGLRLLDRDAAAAANSASARLPARAREQRRPGRPLRDGAGRAPGRRPLPGAAADVQGAAAGGLLRAVLRDRRARGFARGFSIQTVCPLPIGWAEHVLADGHWGAALREYMRDYNHWAVLGVARASSCR